jgi:S1-C subfamily serine protease
MTGKRRVTATRALMMILFTMALAWCGSTDSLARAIVERWQDAVVTVKIVSEQYEYESKAEAFGTIVDSSGIVVLSLARADPGSAGMWDAGADRKIKDIKIMTADGSEIAAEILLRDVDLDLLFIRPVGEKGGPFPAVRLSDSSTPDILDEILILSRLGETAGYVPLAALSRIHAIIKKPRTLYVSDIINVFSGLGTPAFTLDGRVVGILLVRVAKSENLSADIFAEFGGMMPVIVPAEEIQSVVKKIK